MNPLKCDGPHYPSASYPLNEWRLWGMWTRAREGCSVWYIIHMPEEHAGYSVFLRLCQVLLHMTPVLEVFIGDIASREMTPVLEDLSWDQDSSSATLKWSSWVLKQSPQTSRDNTGFSRRASRCRLGPFANCLPLSTPTLLLFVSSYNISAENLDPGRNLQ